MKVDVYDVVPNGTPNILIFSNGVVNWNGVLNSNGKLKGDHATDFKGYIEKFIA
jgi:hypothetical protein